MWLVHVEPLPPFPPPLKDQLRVERHLGMYCGCPLLGCCHNEDYELGFNCGRLTQRHFHSGSPESGYLLPWPPRDEPGPAWLTWDPEP